MSGNTFGHLFRVTTFGESHGAAIGGIVDGVPPGIALGENDIQPYLDRRRPGQSRFTTQRRERDRIHVLSGVFEGRTTGAPIGFVIFNEDARSKDYETIKDVFRPGHADYTYQMKYGLRDWRGSGRASARETAVRVAAGAIARKVLGSTVVIRGALIQIGTKRIERKRWKWAEVARNPFFCPDAEAARAFEAYLDGIRKKGSSVGAVIEVVAEGVPLGLGAPVFDRLDADIAKAMMSIPAVKGVEIGAGFAAAALTGPENADGMRAGKKGRPRFLSNNAGGILGGISSGQDIVVRFAVKPTSSILIPQPTVTVQGKNTTVSTKGRHDPCVGIRAVPIGEAMLALVLADHWLRQRGQCGK
ncbi:MAG: chorismate synthase [Rhodospirillales bacterium]|nr:chorismate synthase [Rhodospirillales bacterium]